jgi:Lrp/AsnC family transcriptional regulator
MIDQHDRKLLALLQHDSGQSLEDLSAAAGLSRNACWRRVKRLEEDGYLRKRVALLDRERLGLGLTVFIVVRTTEHSPKWLEQFARAVRGFPEILAVYRMTGDMDYLLHAVVPDVGAYDRLYKRLINKVTLADVSSSFVMEEIKFTTELPLGIALPGGRARAERP